MKMRRRLSRNSIPALALAVALLVTGCGSANADAGAAESTAADDSKKTTYTVEIISDSDDAASVLTVQGIRAAADEKLRTDKSKLEIQLDTGKTSDKDLKEIVNNKPDLIVTNGERALVAAAKATTKIPIVASNVMNYQQIVGIEAAGGSGSWDRLTGRNITGVSSAPNVTATLSLIIEATEHLDSVGILYTSLDDDAVFQNSRLEEYLDEAGIKWTEYEVAMPGQTAPAAGGTSIIGNEPAAGGSVSSNEAALPAKGTQPVPSAEETVAKAAGENSVLFVSRGSLLSGRAQMIAEVAQSAGKGLIAEDQTFGQYALATLYSNPYDEGYKAGTMAASILADGKKIEKMKVQSIGLKDEHKLYNADYAKKLGITFPKSFTEFDTYFKEQSVSGNEIS